MNIYEKLLYIQQNLKAPKNQYNQFGNFHYRSCEDIQEAVKPLLAEVKAVLLVGDEIVQIGSRFYIKATAAIQDTESGEAVSNTAYARESEEKPKMDAAQVTGSCSSYARKYALNGLFCIDDAKDPDSQSGQPEAAKGQQDTQNRAGTAAGRASAADLNKLRKEAERTGTSLQQVCERYKVRSVNELSKEQCARAMSAFSKMPTVLPSAQEGQYELDFNGMESDMPFR